MKAQDVAELAEARVRNPLLTHFDTGEQLEPELEFDTGPGTILGYQVKTGVVWFTNDESNPVLGIDAHPSQVDDDTVVLNVDTMGLAGDKLKIIVNDGAICHFDPETEEPPMVELKEFIAAQIQRLPFGTTTMDALANIAEHIGMHVVRDEKGVAAIWQNGEPTDEDIVANALNHLPIPFGDLIPKVQVDRKLSAERVRDALVSLEKARVATLVPGVGWRLTDA